MTERYVFEVMPFPMPAFAGEPPSGVSGLGQEIWEAEASRGSREYNRWVQESLNKIMGLRLVADGILGPQSRAAIRSFQQRNGLVADGIVGPVTEAAIKAAAGAPVKPPALKFVKGFSGPAAECTAALSRAGKTREEALAIINTQVGTAIRMLRKAAKDLKRGSRSNETRSRFLKIFRVTPEFVPTWLKTTDAIQDRGDVVRARCLRVAELLESGALKFFCAINGANCPDCGGASPDDFACSSFGVPIARSRVLCLGTSFWDDMKAGNTTSMLSTLMHEPFHIYFGRYVTEHDTHPDGTSVGKFGGINCIVQFVFEANHRAAPDRVSQRCAATTLRNEISETFETNDREWQGELAPGSPDYNRWVQSSLNKILGTSLSIDGSMGPLTRSAIRSFQQKRGLVADGVVGKQTEAAILSALGGAAAPPKKAEFRYVKDFSGAAAECTAAMTRAGKTKDQALTIINEQIGIAIAMLRKAAADLKRGSRTSQTRARFLNIFGVKPAFVPTWLKTTAAIQDRGDVVRVRCLRVANLLASGKIKFFCAVNSTNCPDCGGSPNAVACSSYGVPVGTSNVICLGNGFWDDMKNNNIDSVLAALMHEPFHIYFGRYVTEHGHPDGSSVGKFGGIYCITQFVFEASTRNYPQMHKDRCSNTPVRNELGPLEMEEEDEVNRSSAEYVRWIQSSLNLVSGARLVVDGVLGTLTRSAIRSFQQRYGLSVDGIVGPITEQALIKAGASSPPGSGAPSSPSPSQPSPAAPARLAGQVLDHDNITLWPFSPTGSSSSDGADALSNINDTSNGKAARRSGYENAPGGSVYLDQRMLDGLLKMAKTYDMRVTSIAGGSHSGNSLHYSGVAFDVDEINGVHVTASNPYYRAFMQMCRSLGAREVLGPGDKGHDTHVHCAW